MSKKEKGKFPISEGLPPKEIEVPTLPITGRFYRMKRKNGFYSYEAIVIIDGVVISKTETEEDIFPIIAEKVRNEMEICVKEL